MGILVACYGDSYGDTGSVEAWVPEVADQTAPQTVLHRYHFADHSAFAALRPLRSEDP